MSRSLVVKNGRLLFKMQHQVWTKFLEEYGSLKKRIRYLLKMKHSFKDAKTWKKFVKD